MGWKSRYVNFGDITKSNMFIVTERGNLYLTKGFKLTLFVITSTKATTIFYQNSKCYFCYSNHFIKAQQFWEIIRCQHITIFIKWIVQLFIIFYKNTKIFIYELLQAFSHNLGLRIPESKKTLREF